LIAFKFIITDSVMIHSVTSDFKIDDQSADNLVEGVSDTEEYQFNYSFYNGKTLTIKATVSADSFTAATSSTLAQSLPRTSMNGEWRVIVRNVAYHTETQRAVTCHFPGASCRTLA